MSRTDKDVPNWVRAEEWEPRHTIRCEFGREDCSLPVEPSYHRPGKFRFHRGCVWLPSYDLTYDLRMRGTPHWFATLYFTRPERAKVRDTLKKAKAEYKATGEVDVEPPTEQHRHSARWLWW